MSEDTQDSESTRRDRSRYKSDSRRVIRATAIVALILAGLWLMLGVLVNLGCRSENADIKGAFYILVWRGHQVLPFGHSSLVLGLTHSDRFTRGTTAAIIGYSGITSASQDLARAFEAEHVWEVRVDMADALVALDQIDVVPALVRVALRPTPANEPYPWYSGPRLARWDLHTSPKPLNSSSVGKSAGN